MTNARINGGLSAIALAVALISFGLACAAATLEDRHVRVEIGEKGELVSLVCKATGHDWAGKGSLWRLYFDKRYTPPGTPFAKVREEREIPVEAADQTPIDVSTDPTKLFPVK